MSGLYDQLRRHTPRRIRRWAGPRVARLINEPRAFPDFVIVGAQKAGTTSLYKYLITHPQVVGASWKELHFFDIAYHRGVAWYRSHFPRRRALETLADQLGRPVITGESSPYYLFHPHALRRLAEHVPDTKLIVLLRDPVTRAYSHYQHQVRRGREALSFEEAIEREPERLRGEQERMLADESYDSFNYRQFSYLARGIYIDQLRELCSRFPASRVLVLKSETFFEQTQVVYDRVTDFLGLSRMALGPARTSGGGTSTPVVPGEQALRDYFEPYNASLHDLLGAEFAWQRRLPAASP